MSKECKYRLPCGWCDRRNKECTLDVSKTTDITEIATPERDHSKTADAITAYSRHCGNCNHIDTMCYIPDPAQVKCKITGRYHFYNDKCDCDTITALNDCPETLTIQ